MNIWNLFKSLRSLREFPCCSCCAHLEDPAGERHIVVTKTCQFGVCCRSDYPRCGDTSRCTFESSGHRVTPVCGGDLFGPHRGYGGVATSVTSCEFGLCCEVYSPRCGDTSRCFDAATWKPVTPVCDDSCPFFCPPPEAGDNFMYEERTTPLNKS